MAVTTPQAPFADAALAPPLPGVAIIVPARDAAGTIAPTLRALLDDTAGVVGEVLVVDDASDDGTADVVRGLRAEYGRRLRLLVNDTRVGHGGSVKRGFREHAWLSPFVGVVHADVGPVVAGALMEMLAALRLHPLPDVVIDEHTPIVVLHREVLTREDVDRMADGDLFHPQLRRLLGGKPRLVTRAV
ncbi:MAG TPA: glycosyltransferase [Baekduia sp.]|uniref:glycosyltransferase n=1 Tax=Baekduia sp. TaxID=2600305 RepID=UPI002D786010|nr:glycosyltransferase [Baekduia sp.]HET6509845.1 glycosyltransferase [Baekduia sp.]